MHKKLIAIFIVMMILLTGCKTSSNVNIPKQTDEDVFLVSLKNTDITLYKNISAQNGFSFDIISSKKLDNNISAVIDIKTPYKLLLEENKKEKMPYYVFQNYQDVDWNKMYDLHAEAMKDGEPDINSKEFNEFNSYSNKYEEEYKKFLKKDKYNKLYYYTATINFDVKNESNDMQDEQFKNIKFKVDNKEYKFNIGTVNLDYTKKIDIDADKCYLSTDTIAVSDKPIVPSSEGSIVLNDFDFRCEKDLTITGIRILNEDVDIKEVSLSITDGDQVIDEKMDKGKTIKCKKNAAIKPNIKLSDKKLMNKQLYSTIIYGLIDYEADGKKYSTPFEIGYRIRPDFYELIAIEKDNINFNSYYNNYCNLIDEDK